MSALLAAVRQWPQGPQVVHAERVLAAGRAFLTVTGLLAIYLDPAEPQRLQELTYGVLAAYAIYSLAILALVRSASTLDGVQVLTLHALDILWTSALTFVSEGPVSPFYLFFLFTLLAAAFRWGFRETVATACLVVVIFLSESVLASIGPWLPGSFPAMNVELNRIILRVAYLLMTGFLLGYLAEQQRHSRAELAALAKASRQPNIALGLGGSVVSSATHLLDTLDARSVAFVVQERATLRTMVWQIDRHSSGLVAAKRHRFELDDTQRAMWLFPDPGAAWLTRLGRGSTTTARVVQPGVWPLARLPIEVPLHLADRPFTTLAAVNLGLEGEWVARAYLFDPAIGGAERALHLLASLAEQVTPALTNVFLLRRLRTKAGATERARVSRELHDGAIQSLYGLDMQIEALKRGPTSADAMAQGLLEAQAVVRREVQSLRDLMQALQPIEIDDIEQLQGVLASVVERFRRDTGISARFLATGSRVQLTPAAAIEVVRIVQEALVNVRKHSHGRTVLVRLENDTAGRCKLTIEDDGQGFEFEGRLTAAELDQRRIGPAIIRERARAAKAGLVVESVRGEGARLELTFEGGGGA